jgi:rRNA maturation protein Rpf1
VRLRSLNEAECYARCHGEGDGDNVRVVKLEPRRPRFDLEISGEDLRRAFEVRLDKREPVPELIAGATVASGEPAAAA